MITPLLNIIRRSLLFSFLSKTRVWIQNKNKVGFSFQLLFLGQTPAVPHPMHLLYRTWLIVFFFLFFLLLFARVLRSPVILVPAKWPLTKHVHSIFSKQRAVGGATVFCFMNNSLGDQRRPRQLIRYASASNRRRRRASRRIAGVLSSDLW